VADIERRSLGRAADVAGLAAVSSSIGFTKRVDK
jgi:hypothetical protein